MSDQSVKASRELDATMTRRSQRFFVLVCGGRDYADRGNVCVTLCGILNQNGPLHIVQGGAEGADGLAREWAQSECLPMTTFPADWQQHGKKAGPLRNQQMLDEIRPHLVVAFPGGRGTADMVRRAEAAGVPVLKIDAETLPAKSAVDDSPSSTSAAE